MTVRLKIVLTSVIAAIIFFGGSALLLIRYANRIIKVELETRLGKTFSIDAIDLKWGHVEARGIRLRNSEGKEVMVVERVEVRADFMQAFRREYVISSLVLNAPYVLVESDHKGEIVNPPLPFKFGKIAREDAGKAAPVPITVKRLEIVNGAVDYRDGKARKAPVLTRVRSVNLRLGNIRIPFADDPSPFEVSASVSGNTGSGLIRTTGWIKLGSLDLEGKWEVRDLDITGFKPYFQKETDVNITRGFIDVDATMRVSSRNIRAPGRAVLKNLQFSSRPGIGNHFMGVPLTVVIAFMKQNGDRIPVNFVVEGNLDNPRFDLRENFVARLSEGMADKLGFSLKQIGQGMVGAGEAGIKGVGKSLKKLFTR